MALTIAITEHGIQGNKRCTRGTIAFDNSYPTNGEAFTARQLGLSVIDTLQVSPRNGVVFEPNIAGLLLRAMVQGVDVGAAGALGMDDFPVQGVGATTISVSLTSTGGSAIHRFGALKEAANTQDLSTLTGVPWEAVGV